MRGVNKQRKTSRSDKMDDALVAAADETAVDETEAGGAGTAGAAGGRAKKVVLAYSGGLDTSVIVRWLQDNYNCEVVTFTADIGQGEEVEPARAKAKAAGVIHYNNLIKLLISLNAGLFHCQISRRAAVPM